MMGVTFNLPPEPWNLREGDQVEARSDDGTVIVHTITAEEAERRSFTFEDAITVGTTATVRVRRIIDGVPWSEPDEMR